MADPRTGVNEYFRDWELDRVGNSLSVHEQPRKGPIMPMLRRLTAVAGAAAAARSFVRKNPDKVNSAAAKAGQFIDKRTKGKYHTHIDGAVRKVRGMTGDQGPRKA